MIAGRPIPYCTELSLQVISMINHVHALQLNHLAAVLLQFFHLCVCTVRKRSFRKHTDTAMLAITYTTLHMTCFVQGQSIGLHSI